MGRKAKLPRVEGVAERTFSWDSGALGSDDPPPEAPEAVAAEAAEVALEDEPDDVEYGPDECGRQFCHMLMHLKGTKLSAKEASLLAYWAAGAGAVGFARTLGYPPNRQSGSYSYHWDRVTTGRVAEEVFHDVRIPIFHKYDATIVEESVATVPCHVGLLEEWAEKQEEIKTKLGEAIADGSLGTVYAESPVVREKRPEETVLAYAIYVDGISFSRHESVVGFWTHLLPTGARSLIAVLRSSEFCCCGCRGWCTLYPVWLMIAWSISWLRRGLWPTEREDGAWGEADGFWVQMAGKPLGFKAVCTFVKLDLKEVSGNMGFAGVTTISAPCACCLCTQDDWDDFEDLSAEAHGWPALDLRAYEAATTACERRVRLDRAGYSDVRRTLDYKIRNKAGQGRVLSEDLPGLGLAKGDILRPSPELPNTAAFDELRPEPGQSLEVVFWRPSLETRVRKRNPIWSEQTGLSPCKNLAADNLHLLSLGILLYWIGAVLHQLVASDIYRTGSRAPHATKHSTLAALKSAMSRWQAEERRAGRPRTLPGNFTTGMMGNRGGPVSLQGAEANDFTHFLVQAELPALRERLVGIRWDSLVTCGEPLVLMLSVLKAYKGQVPLAQRRVFVDGFKEYSRLAKMINLPFVPKNHWLAHLCVQLGDLGSSAAIATWRDEQYNQPLKQITSKAHQAHWHARTLAEFRRTHGAGRVWWM